MNRLLTANILCLVFILSGALTGNCQESYTYQGKRYNPYLDRFSLSIGGGLSAYQGELSTFFNPKLQRYYLNPNLGANLAYRFNDYLSFMGETNIFLLSSDAQARYNSPNNRRIFWSYNFDYFLAAAVDILPQKKIDGRFSKWNLALFGGIGQVNFFPRNNKQGGKKSGEIINGNPADTTSAAYNFASLSVIYPVGAIAKYYIDKNQFISLEGNYRFTKTFFLDAFRDTSSGKFDKYFTLQFKYTIIFDSNPHGYFNYNKYQKNTKKSMNQ